MRTKSPAAPRVGVGARVVMILGAALVAAHIFATAVFTGPDTPIKSSLEPELSRYFLGPLDQGWNLFAPGPYNRDEYMLVRARTSADAEPTPWINVTSRELERAGSNIFSDRESRQSKAVHGRYWTQAIALDGEARDAVAASHVDGSPVFGVDLFSSEASDVISPARLSQLQNYSRYEAVAVGLGSLYAIQEWGDDVTQVEVRMRRNSVVPFAQRHDPDAVGAEGFIYIGWRDVTPFDEEVLAAWR